MRWFLGLLLMCAGCSFEHPLHGDVSFSPDERAAVERGNVWLAEQIGREPVGIVWDLPHGEEPELAIIRAPMPYGRGLTTKGRIYLPEQIYSLDKLAALSAHEFGHFQGLAHHAGPGIMNEAVQTLTWTAEDQTACTVCQ